MCSSNSISDSQEHLLDNTIGKPVTFCNGINSRQDHKRVQNRQKRKFLSSNLSSRLIDYLHDLTVGVRTNDMIVDHIPKERLKTILNQTWNVFRCADTMTVKQRKIVGNYCRCRVCFVCNSIRQMKNYHNYKNYFEQFPRNELRFVTLTMQSCLPSDLKSTIQYMNKTFSKIVNCNRQRYKRGQMDKFIGVRCLEMNFNEETKRFNPHFHLIVVGIDNANMLVRDWLKRNRKNGIELKPIAQVVKRVSDDQKAYKELFKYITKITSNSKSNSKDNNVYLSSVVCILDATYNMNTINRFGFNGFIEKDEKDGYEIDIESMEFIEPTGVFEWCKYEKDWYNLRTYELLSKAPIPEHLKRFVQTRIIDTT